MLDFTVAMTFDQRSMYCAISISNFTAQMRVNQATQFLTLKNPYYAYTPHN